ncbi:MAG: aldo/keto reductase [Bacteroidota bacterium]
MPDNKKINVKLDIPQIVFGTAGLGNLFVAHDDATKLEIIKECVEHSLGKTVFDTAGKYGAGLALEVLGKSFKALNLEQDDVIISNKLGWYRVPLTTDEPTFEPGVWRDLKHDAIQKISYNGILECFEQGNELLNGYTPQWVSIHDPDEYLAKATNPNEDAALYHDILQAYKALEDLKKQGKVSAIGVGAKDWHSIRRIAKDVKLDWVMFANSVTIYHHPKELLDFVNELHEKGVLIINSAVFHSGFLIGSDYYNYKLMKRDNASDKHLFEWRDAFYAVCQQYQVKPAHACVHYALKIKGVDSIALSTTDPKRVKENIDILKVEIPAAFWETLWNEKLISNKYNG